MSDEEGSDAEKGSQEAEGEPVEEEPKNILKKEDLQAGLSMISRTPGKLSL